MTEVFDQTGCLAGPISFTDVIMFLNHFSSRRNTSINPISRCHAVCDIGIFLLPPLCSAALFVVVVVVAKRLGYPNKNCHVLQFIFVFPAKIPIVFCGSSVFVIDCHMAWSLQGRRCKFNSLSTNEHVKIHTRTPRTI